MWVSLFEDWKDVLRLIKKSLCIGGEVWRLQLWVRGSSWAITSVSQLVYFWPVFNCAFIRSLIFEFLFVCFFFCFLSTSVCLLSVEFNILILYVCVYMYYASRFGGLESCFSFLTFCLGGFDSQKRSDSKE